MTGSLENLNDLIATFSRHDDRPAVIAMEEKDSRTWSYRELEEKVLALAAGLTGTGFGPGGTAALLSDNSPEWLAAALAIIRAGGVVLPLDAQMGDDNLRHILQDSEVELLFINREQAERLEKLAAEKPPRLLRLDREEGEDSWTALLDDGQTELPERQGKDQAALFYTSGTTGPPKGVPLTHHNLAFQVNTVQQTGLVGATDRVLLPLPLHHVYPFVIGMLVPLGLGLPIILPGSLTGPQIIRTIRKQEPSVIIGVPRLYRALLSGILSQAAEKGKSAEWFFKLLLGFSSMLRRRSGLSVGRYLLRPVHRKFGPFLRILASGGSPLDPELAWKLEGLGWQVAVGYGLTETAPLLTIKLPGGGRLDSAGKPVSGVELRIDREAAPSSRTETAAKIGEVLARGPNVFEGYRNLPDKTDEAFSRDNWFRTGDLGYLDGDGYLYLAGRASTVIVTESGKNIQPGEVEKVYEEHPVIEEIGILERDGKLAAVIIPHLPAVRKQDTEIDTAVQEAVSAQAGKLPSYQRVAEYVISRESLPRTRLGKIKRHLLPERYQQAKDEEQGKGKPEKGPMPREEMNDQDRALLDNAEAAMVWDWLAERFPDSGLTPDTSPQLDLDIDSLEWLNLTMEISRRTGRELDEDDIARIEKVRDLLQTVAEKSGSKKDVDPERPLTNPHEVLRDEQKRWLQPLNSAQAILRSFVYYLNRLLMRILFRLEVRGYERLPENRQFVLIANHVSLLDPFALAASLPLALLDRMYFSGWTGMAFSNPLVRFGSRLAQAVPIDSRRAVASSLAFGAAVLKNGDNLIWFPEGGRSSDGSLQEFKLGIGLLLKHYPVMVVPVHIKGAHDALPMGKRWPRLLTRISLRIGEPVEVEGLVEEAENGEPEKEIIRHLRQVMKTLSHETD